MNKTRIYMHRYDERACPNREISPLQIKMNFQRHAVCHSASNRARRGLMQVRNLYKAGIQDTATRDQRHFTLEGCHLN